MPKICGIIAEYNPFHNGHAGNIALAAKTSGADAVVVALGGNFVQRGEPALIDKFRRTYAALSGGAHMVLELPLPYASASAEAFARGGCRLLAATNFVDCIAFGSEAGDLTPLQKLATLLCNETADFKRELQGGLRSGLSFPAARALAAEAVLPGSAAVLAEPNNILSVEYLKAIAKENLPLVPFALKRQGTAAAHHNAADLVAGVTSATSIRRHLAQGGDIDALKSVLPPDSRRILREQHSRDALNHLDYFSSFLHYAMLNTSQRDLDEIYCLPKDLQKRIITAATANYLISDVISSAKAKNMTYTAISRAILQIILKIPARMREMPPPYIRVLGVRASHRHLISQLHNFASLPVITNLKSVDSLPRDAKLMLELELAATKTYWLALKAQGIAAESEFAQGIVVVS